MSGFSGFIGISYNLHVELFAMLQGLILAWNACLRNLICYTNSLNVITLIREQLPPFHKYAVIVQDIHDLLQRNWEVVIRHTLREGNQCADFMAKMGAS